MYVSNAFAKIVSPFRDLNDSAACNPLFATHCGTCTPESYRNLAPRIDLKQFQAIEGSDSGELVSGTRQLLIKFANGFNRSCNS
jgi:hypothetical protein